MTVPKLKAKFDKEEGNADKVFKKMIYQLNEVLGGDLVFELLIESKLVFWFPIWHFVPPEPVDCGLQVARFQAPDITDV